MLTAAPISCLLPERTFSLTFDDGPGTSEGTDGGPRTLELAEYLASEKVFATFFVIGSRAQALPEVVRRVHALGHLIGNHTQDHVRLDKMVAKNEDPAPQILSADAVIRDITGETSTPILFRAPYGMWNDDVARRLEGDPRFHCCIGPIHWDLPMKKHDWHFWGCQLPAEPCAQAIMQDAENHGSGIILLHDHSSSNALAQNNRTFEMVKLLVPRMKAKGYRFVRLDEIDAIQSAMAA